MKVLTGSRRHLWLLLICLPQMILSQTDRLSFGRIDLEMASTSVSETNALLKSILAETVTFLDASFFSAKDYVFQNVACSIVSYSLGGGAGNGMFYANVTIGGSVHFQQNSGVDQRQVLELAEDAFRNGYIEALSNSEEAFLRNLQSIALTLNGKTVLDATDGEEMDFSDPDDENNVSSQTPDHLAIWMVATIAGGAAFMCVVCISFACVCCIPRSSSSSKARRRKGKRHLGVITAGNSDPTDDEEMAEEKTPSPARSLMSQDSSVFTYNPKSVTKLKSDEEDDSPKNNPWKPVVSKPSKDLSLIEECSENSSEQSTPRGKLPHLEHGNLTSLLTSPISPGPGFDFEGNNTYNPLTEESIRELEWAAERSLAFNDQCSPFQKCQAPEDEEGESFFASTTKPKKQHENASCDNNFDNLLNQFEFSDK